MDGEAEVREISEVAFLLRGGGLYGLVLLLLGAVLTLWGAVDLAFVRNRVVLAAQSLLSFLPLALGVCGVLAAMLRFSEISTSDAAPKPADLAEIVAFALACGIFGPLATALPAGLGILALANRGAGRRAPRVV